MPISAIRLFLERLPGRTILVKAAPRDARILARSGCRASFDGDYGSLWLEAFPVIEHHGRIVAATMTVRRAPWHQVPDCPFIIELFTDRTRRFRARRLVRLWAATVSSAGETRLALRVANDMQPPSSCTNRSDSSPHHDSSEPNRAVLIGVALPLRGRSRPGPHAGGGCRAFPSNRYGKARTQGETR